MQQATLQTHYAEKVSPELMKKFGYANPHQVPGVKKNRYQLWLQRDCG